MKTAVQLRDDHLFFSYTMMGKPSRVVEGKKGSIALYEDGHLIVFIVEKGSNKRAFIFETDVTNGTHVIPGVYPAVRLLVETRTKGKTHRLQKYLHYAIKNKIVLQQLPEDFFLRLNTLLEERNTKVKDFYNLLLRWA